MSEYVRVRDKQTKHEYTVRADRVIPEGHTVLDKPALDRHGDPAPVKFNKPLPKISGAAPAPGKNGQSAGSEEDQK